MLPKGFVYLSKVCDSIAVDLMYLKEDNFTGGVVPGYKRNVAIVTKECATQLAKVQGHLSTMGLGLKVKDAYRPQDAILAFRDWSLKQEDFKTKELYYPDIDKYRLFDLGYISKRSSHNRGSTIDLTVVRLKDNSELDMGTRVDFFGDQGHTDSQNVSDEAKKNRKILKESMELHGFENFDKEWWDYRLKDEPIRDSSISKPFNFYVE